MHDAPAPKTALESFRTFLILALVSMLLCMPLAHAAASSSTAASPAGQTISLDQLADIIANDKTRDQLVQDLRKAAASEQTAPASAEAASAQTKSTQATGSTASSLAPPPAGQDKTLDHAPTTNKAGLASAQEQASATAQRVSFARRFAQLTASWSETIGLRVSKTWHTVAGLTKSHPNQPKRASFDARVFGAAALRFAAVAVSTIVAFLVLRALASLIFSAIGRFAARHETDVSGSLIRRGTAIFLAIVVDILVVGLACGAGYAAGLYAIGQSGTMGTRESLFINAFALIELAKVVIRAFFAARYEHLRLLHIPTEIAAWWSVRLRFFVSVVGYALLVVVPIINAQLTFFIGALVTFLVMGGAYIYALKVIFGNRLLLTQRIMEKAENAQIGFFSVLYRLLARLWVIIAVFYFTALFLVSQVDPSNALPFMMSATLQTVVAAAVGFGLSGMLSRAIGHRINFSDSLRDKLPMLEARVNSYVPTGLQVVRVVILLVFAAVVANAWHLFDFGEWISSTAGLKTVSVSIKVAIILVAAALFWLLSASIIEHRLSPNTGRGVPSARQQTLLVLFRNALAIVIATFTVMITLSQIGVNIGPLIAGAGVFGLAIGFGAQSLVKDIITGVFIQLENAMNAGDVVSVGGITGTAERLTIRSVSIRDIDGTYHIVPFSSATVVSNYMRDWSYFRVEYGIAYREDIDNAIYYLREAFAELKTDEVQGPNIIEDMSVPGVTALADSAVNIRIMIKTLPGKQFGVGRAMNRLVKYHFDRAGIEIPFPHQTLWFGEDRNGDSPAANLRVLEVEDEEAPRELKTRRRGDDAAPPETGDAPS